MISAQFFYHNLCENHEYTRTNLTVYRGAFGNLGIQIQRDTSMKMFRVNHINESASLLLQEGLIVGDLIESVNKENLFAKSDFEATNCLEGPPFSQVDLVILRKNFGKGSSPDSYATVQRKDDQICDLHKTKVEVDSSHQFFSIQGKEILDYTNVHDWNLHDVSVWLRIRGFEREIPIFKQNRIDGPVLLKLKEEDLSELGIGKVGVVVKLYKEVSLLKRLHLKPNTKKLFMRNPFRLVFGLFTFHWAQTSEVVDGDAEKDECVNVNVQIAIVSSLAFSFTWNMLFHSATLCMCNGDNSDCLCKRGFDVRPPIPASVMYCSATIACIFFMWALIISIVMIIAVNEMSDEKEIFLLINTVMSASSQNTSGKFFTLGMLFMSLPVGIYCLYNQDFGLERIEYSQPSNLKTFAFGICCAACILIALLWVFAWIISIPRSIGLVYASKLKASEDDINTWIQSKRSFRELDNISNNRSNSKS